MKIIFVTATNTNVGKTYTTLKLIESFSELGVQVGVCKPIETGVTSEPLDAQLLLNSIQEHNSNFEALKPKEITAYTFKLPAAPFCADSEKRIRIETIKNKIVELQKKCDLLIVEGAGGLMVPITKEYYMIDLIEELNAMTLLVTSSKLGCINETELSMNALQSKNIAFEWCVNLFEDKEAFQEVTQPYYDENYPNWWSIDEGLPKFTASFMRRYLHNC